MKSSILATVSLLLSTLAFAQVNVSSPSTVAQLRSERIKSTSDITFQHTNPDELTANAMFLCAMITEEELARSKGQAFAIIPAIDKWLALEDTSPNALKEAYPGLQTKWKAAYASMQRRSAYVGPEVATKPATNLPTKTATKSPAKSAFDSLPPHPKLPSLANLPTYRRIVESTTSPHNRTPIPASWPDSKKYNDRITAIFKDTRAISWASAHTGAPSFTTMDGKIHKPVKETPKSITKWNDYLPQYEAYISDVRAAVQEYLDANKERSDHFIVSDHVMSQLSVPDTGLPPIKGLK